MGEIRSTSDVVQRVHRMNNERTEMKSTIRSLN